MVCVSVFLHPWVRHKLVGTLGKHLTRGHSFVLTKGLVVEFMYSEQYTDPSGEKFHVYAMRIDDDVCIYIRVPVECVRLTTFDRDSECYVVLETTYDIGTTPDETTEEWMVFVEGNAWTEREWSSHEAVRHAITTLDELDYLLQNS